MSLVFPLARVHNVMLALRKVVKRFEFKPKDARGPLLAVMRVTLPILKPMSHQLIGDDSAEAGQVRSMIGALTIVFREPTSKGCWMGFGERGGGALAPWMPSPIEKRQITTNPKCFPDDAVRLEDGRSLSSAPFSI